MRSWSPFLAGCGDFRLGTAVRQGSGDRWLTTLSCYLRPPEADRRLGPVATRFVSSTLTLVATGVRLADLIHFALRQPADADSERMRSHTMLKPW